MIYQQQLLKSCPPGMLAMCSSWSAPPLACSPCRLVVYWSGRGCGGLGGVGSVDCGDGVIVMFSLLFALSVVHNKILLKTEKMSYFNMACMLTKTIIPKIEMKG